jgi:dolichyl-diphosphooligosaccharide--protein glycosyltransferase
LFLAIQMGIVSLPAERFLSILNPFLRETMPIIESVQEHRPATWASIYYQFGLLLFLVPLGFYFAFKKQTNHNLFLIIFALTTIYFSSSMIRLTLIMAPAFCALGALAVVELSNSFLSITKSRTVTRRRRRFVSHVGKGFSWSFFICLFLITTFTLTKGIETANMPSTIASSSVPVRANLDDWEEALTWMSESLPSDAVLASWWDYGYWITVGGNRTSLADNGTLNTTQIALIGRMFLSNETEALAILKPLNVTHVVAFSTLSIALSAQQSLFYGDEAKWYWMAEIGGLSYSDLQDTSVTSILGLSGFYLPPKDAVLTKLMVYGALGAPDVSTLVDEYGLPSELRPSYFQMVFLSSNRMVSIYRVRYEVEPI